jgi:hypothetical protein
MELPYPAYFLHLHRGLTLFRALFRQACEVGLHKYCKSSLGAKGHRVICCHLPCAVLG